MPLLPLEAIPALARADALTVHTLLVAHLRVLKGPLVLKHVPTQLPHHSVDRFHDERVGLPVLKLAGHNVVDGRLQRLPDDHQGSLEVARPVHLPAFADPIKQLLESPEVLGRGREGPLAQLSDLAYDLVDGTDERLRVALALELRDIVPDVEGTPQLLKERVPRALELRDLI